MFIWQSDNCHLNSTCRIIPHLVRRLALERLRLARLIVVLCSFNSVQMLQLEMELVDCF